MANNHSTLTGLFTDIADAIRAKGGGGGDTLTWDGNTEGLEEAVEGSGCYKISSVVPTMDDFLNGAAIMLNGESINLIASEIFEALPGYIVVGEWVLCVPSDNFDLDGGATIKSKGVYFMPGVSSLTIHNYTGFASKIVADNFPEAIAAIDTQEDLDPELATQDDLITQLTSALEGKAGVSGGGAEIETCTVSFAGGRGHTTRTICTRLINGVITTTTEFYTGTFTDIVRGTILCAIDEGDDCIPASVSGNAEIVYDLYDYGIKSGSIIAINGNCTIHLEHAYSEDPA